MCTCNQINNVWWKCNLHKTPIINSKVVYRPLPHHPNSGYKFHYVVTTSHGRKRVVRKKAMYAKSSLQKRVNYLIFPCTNCIHFECFESLVSHWKVGVPVKFKFNIYCIIRLYKLGPTYVLPWRLVLRYNGIYATGGDGILMGDACFLFLYKWMNNGHDWISLQYTCYYLQYFLFFC